MEIIVRNRELAEKIKGKAYGKEAEQHKEALGEMTESKKMNIRYAYGIGQYRRYGGCLH